MQLSADTVSSSSFPASNFGAQAASSAAEVSYTDYKIIRRNGVVRVICTDPRHKQRQG